jgi:hypothetical protein
MTTGVTINDSGSLGLPQNIAAAPSAISGQTQLYVQHDQLHALYANGLILEMAGEFPKNAVFAYNIGNSFAPVSPPYAPVALRRFNDVVFVTGGVARLSGSATEIGYLPTSYYPAAREVFMAPAHDGAHYHNVFVEIETNGVVTILDGPGGALDFLLLTHHFLV